MVPVGQFYTFDCDKTAHQEVGKKYGEGSKIYSLKFRTFPKYPSHFAVSHFREILDPPLTFNTRQQLAIFFLEVRFSERHAYYQLVDQYIYK